MLIELSILSVFLIFLSAVVYVILGVGVQRMAKGFNKQMSEGVFSLLAWPIVLFVVAFCGDDCKED